MNIMGILQRSLPAFWSFISKSAWSPSIVFAAAECLVLVLRLRAVQIPWRVLAACLCVVTGASACAYLAIPILQDDVESGIASISALAWRGWPIYPDPNAVHRYIVAYGPLTYAARIPAYWMLGPTLFAFKVTGFLAFLASMTGLYKICRHYAPPGQSLLGVGCCCLVLFRFLPIPFSGRGDPLLVCMAILLIWAALDAPAWVVLLVAGFTFALMPDVKITAGAYLFPLVWLVLVRRGWKTAAGAIALGFVFFSLPFLSSQVSIANYWFSLNNSRHVLRTDILLRNFQYSALLLLPLGTAVFYRAKKGIRLSQDQAVYLWLIILSISTASFVGANFGSGPHHLLPCIGPILHLYFWLESESPPDARVWPFSRFAIAWTLSMLLFSVVNMRAFVSTLSHARAASDAVTEVRNAEAAHRGQFVEVGIGNNFDEFSTVYEALATLDGQPSTIGGLAVRELQVAGMEVPDSTVRYMEACGTQVWLIPKGESPFSAPDPYFGPEHATFIPAFRNAFLGHYRKSSSGRIYDVWTCAN